MQHIILKEGTINEMRDLFRECSPGIDRAAIEQQAWVEAEKLRNIIVDVQNNSDIVGVKHVNRILEKFFKNALAIKAFQWRTCMSTLQENYLRWKRTEHIEQWVQKKTGTIGKSQFTFYKCNSIAVLKKKYRIVKSRQICIRPDY